MFEGSFVYYFLSYLDIISLTRYKKIITKAKAAKFLIRKTFKKWNKYDKKDNGIFFQKSMKEKYRFGKQLTKLF